MANAVGTILNPDLIVLNDVAANAPQLRSSADPTVGVGFSGTGVLVLAGSLLLTTTPVVDVVAASTHTISILTTLGPTRLLAAIP